MFCWQKPNGFALWLILHDGQPRQLANHHEVSAKRASTHLSRSSGSSFVPGHDSRDGHSALAKIAAACGAPPSKTIAPPPLSQSFGSDVRQSDAAFVAVGHPFIHDDKSLPSQPTGLPT